MNEFMRISDLQKAEELFEHLRSLPQVSISAKRGPSLFAVTLANFYLEELHEAE